MSNSRKYNRKEHFKTKKQKLFKKHNCQSGITLQKDKILISTDSLISLCCPFNMPKNTPLTEYIINEQRYNDNVDLSIIYGSLSTKSLLLKKQPLNFKAQNKQSHLLTLFNTLEIIDQHVSNNDTPIFDMPLALESDDSDLESISDSDSTIDLDFISDSILTANTNTILSSNTYGKNRNMVVTSNLFIHSPYPVSPFQLEK